MKSGPYWSGATGAGLAATEFREVVCVRLAQAPELFEFTASSRSFKELGVVRSSDRIASMGQFSSGVVGSAVFDVEMAA